MKSIKRLIMIGVMTLASISMFVGARAANAGDSARAYGPNLQPNNESVFADCLLYNAKGVQDGRWTTTFNDDGTLTHLMQRNDGSTLETVGKPGVGLISWHLINDDAYKSFPELLNKNVVGQDVVDHPENYQLMVAEGNADKSAHLVWDPNGIYAGMNYIEFRCVYVFDLATGRTKACLGCHVYAGKKM